MPTLKVGAHEVTTPDPPKPDPTLADLKKQAAGYEKQLAPATVERFQYEMWRDYSNRLGIELSFREDDRRRAEENRQSKEEDARRLERGSQRWAKWQKSLSDNPQMHIVPIPTHSMTVDEMDAFIKRMDRTKAVVDFTRSAALVWLEPGQAFDILSIMRAAVNDVEETRRREAAGRQGDASLSYSSARDRAEQAEKERREAAIAAIRDGK